MAHGRDDANNGLPRSFIAAVAKTFADCVLIRPIIAREIFVHYCGGLAPEAILVCKCAPTDQRKAHGFKVAGTDRANVSMRSWVARWRTAPFNPKSRRTAKTAK